MDSRYLRSIADGCPYKVCILEITKYFEEWRNLTLREFISDPVTFLNFPENNLTKRKQYPIGAFLEYHLYVSSNGWNYQITTPVWSLFKWTKPCFPESSTRNPNNRCRASSCRSSWGRKQFIARNNSNIIQEILGSFWKAFTRISLAWLRSFLAIPGIMK